MSGLLLDDATFARARDGVRAGTVTPELYAFLGRLVAVTQATRTLAPAPVPGGRWDDPDAVAETVQAWLSEALLDGGLLRAFDICQTPRALSRYLERALRNWLIGRSRRASGPRLLERTVELLDGDDAFVRLRDAPAVAERWWGLAVWTQPGLFAGDDDELASRVWALGDFTLLRFPSSERSDPVLSADELRRFVLELLQRVQAGLSGRHWDQGFRSRFSYAYTTVAVPLQQAPQLAVGGDPADRTLITEAARIALSDLSQRQLRVLIDRPGSTLEQMADQLQVSRGTVDNEYRRAVLKVRAACPSDGSFDAVLETVLEMASEGESV